MVKYAAQGVLPPVLDVCGVRAAKLELAEAVVVGVGAGGRVDDEALASLGIGELLRAFIRGQADVERTTVRRLFRFLIRDTQNLLSAEI